MHGAVASSPLPRLDEHGGLVESITGSTPLGWEHAGAVGAVDFRVGYRRRRDFGDGYLLIGPLPQTTAIEASQSRTSAAPVLCSFVRRCLGPSRRRRSAGNF